MAVPDIVGTLRQRDALELAPPVPSNRHSSTFSACAENRAKFVPRPSQVAPSGCGVPAESRMLAFRNQKNRRKRRKDKA